MTSTSQQKCRGILEQNKYTMFCNIFKCICKKRQRAFERRISVLPLHVRGALNERSGDAYVCFTKVFHKL